MKAMKSHLALSVAVGVVLALAVSVVPARDLFSTSFESGEGYAVGEDIGTKTDWTTNLQDVAVITDAEAGDGTQSLQLNVGAVVDRQISGATANEAAWIEAYFKGPGSPAATPSYPDSPPASAIIHFSATNGIQLYDGTGQTWEQAVDHATIDANKWYQVTLRQDYLTQKWDCFIDGTKQNSAALGFRDASVTKLNGFMNLSDTTSYLDNLRVVEALRGDANGDETVDSADLVRTIQIANDPAPALALIWGGNADLTGSTGTPDGVIDTLDILGVRDLILGI